MDAGPLEKNLFGYRYVVTRYDQGLAANRAGGIWTSQGLESQNLSSVDAASLPEADSQSNRADGGDITSDTSLSQRTEGGAFKKPKKRDRQ